jgi:voltage-gated potassium channel
LGASGVFFFERNVPDTSFASFGDSLWWAVSLTTTINVGYDPLTFEGRVVALLLRAFGMGVFGYLAGSIASYLIGQRAGEEERRGRLSGETITRLADEVERLRLRLERLEPSDRERDAP